MEDSYEIRSKFLMRDILYDFRVDYADTCNVLKYRSDDSMINEWVAHNNLYILHLFRNHTKDVDLNYPQKWYEQPIWWLLSRIVL